MLRFLIFIFALFCCQESFAAPEKKIQRILLVVAMQQEANPIIEKLKLHPSPSSFKKLPMHAYEGKVNNLTIFLITNGQDSIYKVENVGTQAATLTTYLGIEAFHPDLVISIGTAGGLDAKHTAIGEIFVSKKIDFYSRRIPDYPYDLYGLGEYASYSLKNKLPLKKGLICSGDAFDQSDADYQTFLKLNCDAVDMEAAAVAWVSRLEKVPMVAIKGITNNVEGKEAYQMFEKNFAAVTNKLADTLQGVLVAL